MEEVGGGPPGLGRKESKERGTLVLGRVEGQTRTSFLQAAGAPRGSRWALLSCCSWTVDKPSSQLLGF